MHYTTRPFLADEEVDTSVPIIDVDVPTQRVLFHPVNLKVAERYAVPHADGGKAVSAGQGVGQKVGHISAPEFCNARIVEPHLDENNVTHGLEMVFLSWWGGNRTEVGNWLRRGRGDTERQVLSNAGDKTCVKDLTHARGLGAHRVANVVAEGVVERPRWVVGRQVRRGEEGADWKAGDGDYCLWRWRTREVGVEVETGGHRLLWARRPLAPDRAGRSG